MQGDLFPAFQPETVLAMCRRLERRVLAIAPELTVEECFRLMAELSLVDRLADELERRVTSSPEYMERQIVTPVLPLRSLAASRPGWPQRVPASLMRAARRSRKPATPISTPPFYAM